MVIHASAPGKLVLSGEYAVLEGAPALVSAVDARARVTLEDASDGKFRVSAPAAGVREALFGFDAENRVNWIGVGESHCFRLKLTARLIETFGAGQPPFHVHLDTRAFSSGQEKLGLGSSAALTVALAGALCARLQRESPRVEELIALHREWQDRRGSGLDVAASFHGGSLIYRLRDGEPEIQRVRGPESLHWCCVWPGRAASTAAQLNRLAAWRARAPGQYAEHMRELRRIAEVITDAIAASNVARGLDAVAAYAERLHVFGDAAGLDIFGGGHERVAVLAQHCRVVYKPCGAGGGDVGIALTQDPDRLVEFRRELARSHLREIVLQHAACGLQVSREEVEPEQDVQHDHAGRNIVTAC